MHYSVQCASNSVIFVAYCQPIVSKLSVPDNLKLEDRYGDKHQQQQKPYKYLHKLTWLDNH